MRIVSLFLLASLVARGSDLPELFDGASDIESIPKGTGMYEGYCNFYEIHPRYTPWKRKHGVRTILCLYGDGQPSLAIFQGPPKFYCPSLTFAQEKVELNPLESKEFGFKGTMPANKPYFNTPLPVRKILRHKDEERGPDKWVFFAAPFDSHYVDKWALKYSARHCVFSDAPLEQLPHSISDSGTYLVRSAEILSLSAGWVQLKDPASGRTLSASLDGSYGPRHHAQLLAAMEKKLKANVFLEEEMRIRPITVSNVEVFP